VKDKSKNPAWSRQQAELVENVCVYTFKTLLVAMLIIQTE
jgi:hypothetical protein